MTSQILLPTTFQQFSRLRDGGHSSTLSGQDGVVTHSTELDAPSGEGLKEGVPIHNAITIHFVMLSVVWPTQISHFQLKRTTNVAQGRHRLRLPGNEPRSPIQNIIYSPTHVHFPKLRSPRTKLITKRRHWFNYLFQCHSSDAQYCSFCLFTSHIILLLNIRWYQITSLPTIYTCGNRANRIYFELRKMLQLGKR